MRNVSWIFAGSLFATPVLAADKTIEPGLYEIVTKSDAGTNTARKCVSAADIVAGLKPELGPNCKSIRNVVAGGKFDFATTCPDMSMVMTGTYTSTSYVIDGKLTMKGDDEPIVTRISAKRIAETCQ